MLEKIITYLLAIILAIVLISIGAIILALPVMWLWNWIMPSIFGLCTIGFWKSFGILLLCGLLFKGTTRSVDNK